MLANTFGPGHSWNNQPLGAGSGAQLFHEQPNPS
jgi:hypothetical protein